jgi:hypothetical protein
MHQISNQFIRTFDVGILAFVACSRVAWACVFLASKTSEKTAIQSKQDSKRQARAGGAWQMEFVVMCMMPSQKRQANECELPLAIHHHV